MIIPDANLLIYAYDQGAADHDAAKAWWEACLAGTEPVLLCHPVMFAFVRIITSPRLMKVPLSVEDAVTAVKAWIQQPPVEVVLAETAHHEEVFEWITLAGTAGNLTTDAQIAAIALNRGGVVHTNDADFSKFSGLSWHNPLTGKSTKNP